MWYVIMCVTLAVTGVSLLFLSDRICAFPAFGKLKKEKFVISALVVFGFFCAIGGAINFINAIVCAIYFAIIWAISDLLFFLYAKIFHKSFDPVRAGICAVVTSVLALSAGWYLNHNVWEKAYEIKTTKSVKNIKIVMFADSHVGTTFHAEGFAKHLAAMQMQNPDLVIVSGDFVDDDTNRADMIAAAQALGKMKTTYGVYFVFGNHDNGYYGSAYRGFSGREMVAELEKNGVRVLRDEVELIDDMFYVVGRKDFSVERELNGRRKSMDELVKGLDRNKYIIVADHQPTDYKNQAAAQVDLVLSGHTHGGQLFPFNRIGKWIGANDRVYGHEKRVNTNFIVTSGLSDWAIKFKTGCRSEYVTVNVKAAGK